MLDYTKTAHNLNIYKKHNKINVYLSVCQVFEIRRTGFPVPRVRIPLFPPVSRCLPDVNAIH